MMAAPPPLGSTGSPSTLSHTEIRSHPVVSHLGSGVSGPVAWDWQLPGLGTYVDMRQRTLGDPGPAGAWPGSSGFPLQAGFGEWPLNV